MNVFAFILFGTILVVYFYLHYKKREKGKRAIMERIEREKVEAEIFRRELEEMERPIRELQIKEQFISETYHPITPAYFKDVRTECRAEYRDTRKAGNRDGMEKALNTMYINACEFVFCFGSDDNSKGVSGEVFNHAVNKVYYHMDEFRELSNRTYQTFGRISGCRCLSETDWKHFADCWPDAVVDVEA